MLTLFYGGYVDVRREHEGEAVDVSGLRKPTLEVGLLVAQTLMFHKQRGNHEPV
jgi:hypothetical protein